MKIIESIHELCVEDYDSKDSEEFLDSVKEVNEFLDVISTSLDHKEMMKLDDLIASSQVAAEKQGFEMGFKYAMSLIKECGLQ